MKETHKRKHRRRSVSNERHHSHRSKYEKNGHCKTEVQYHRKRERSPTAQKMCKRKAENRTELSAKPNKHCDVKIKAERISEDRNPTAPMPYKDEEDVKPNNLRLVEKWGKGDEKGDGKKVMENKAKPDFGLSGKLAEEVNTFNGVVIKYSEPPEARKPKRRWRLYPFKGDDMLPTMYIHRQSAYLIGRDRKVADLPVDHPSCSKQHAVLQYRIVPYTRPDGTKSRRIRPYIIDLESANGTYVNNKKIEAKKYVELLERDVIKFAYSSREYVLLHEHSQDDGAEEDDNAL